MPSLLASQKLALSLCGLLPFNSRKLLPNSPTILRVILDNGMFLCAFLNLLHVFIFDCYALFLAPGDFSFVDRTAQFQDLSAVTTTLTYLVVFALRQKQVQAAIASVEQDLLPRSLSGIVYITMADSVRRSRAFANGINLFFVSGTIYHALQPLLRGHAYKAFPFQVQYPCAWAYQSPHYELLYLVHLLGHIQLGLLYASFMALFVSVARLLTVQYEMLLCSLRNLVNNAFIRRGDGQSRTLLRQAQLKWRAEKVSWRYFEGAEEEEEDFLRDEASQVAHANDPFECGGYDAEVLVAVAECARRHALILRICREVEDILSFNMLTTIGVLVIVMCMMIFAVTTIGQMNESTVDFVNYLVMDYFEMLVMCYYPHLMSYQVTG